MKNFDEIFKIAKEKNSTIAVACAAAGHILKVAQEAVNLGIAKIILCGDEAKMQQIAADMKIELAQFEIVNETDEMAACRAAVGLVVSGRADAVMKGDCDTSMIMRAVLCKETGMRDGKKLSHIAVFEAPHYHKLMFATDCAVNIAPDFDTKIGIIENTVTALNNLGIAKPKVALLAAK